MAEHDYVLPGLSWWKTKKISSQKPFSIVIQQTFSRISQFPVKLGLRPHYNFSRFPNKTECAHKVSTRTPTEPTRHHFSISRRHHRTMKSLCNPPRRGGTIRHDKISHKSPVVSRKYLKTFRWSAPNWTPGKPRSKNRFTKHRTWSRDTFRRTSSRPTNPSKTVRKAHPRENPGGPWAELLQIKAHR